MGIGRRRGRAGKRGVGQKEGSECSHGEYPVHGYMLPGERHRGLSHGDRNFPRINGRIVGYMVMIPEKQLQGMFSWWKFDARLGFPRPEVKMVSVGRNRLIERRKISIDQYVMVA